MTRLVSDRVVDWVTRAGWSVEGDSPHHFEADQRDVGVRITHDGELFRVFDTEFGATRGEAFHTNFSHAVDAYVLFKAGPYAQREEGRTSTPYLRPGFADLPAGVSLLAEEPDRLRVVWPNGYWANFRRERFYEACHLAHLAAATLEEIENALNAPDGSPLFMSLAERNEIPSQPTGHGEPRYPRSWDEYLVWSSSKGQASSIRNHTDSGELKHE